MEPDLTGATVQLKKEIMEAYLFLRKENMTIPSETLEFMKDAAIERLDRNGQPPVVITIITDEHIETVARNKALKYAFANDYEYDKIVNAIIDGAKFGRDHRLS